MGVICFYPSVAYLNELKATNISRALCGQRPTAGGFVWKHKTPDNISIKPPENNI
jgi:hypothetical protein